MRAYNLKILNQSRHLGRMIRLAKFDGFVFSKLHAIGSKSEGPAYYLQQWDDKEIAIAKKTHLWQEDPALQKYLGKKATIEGKLNDGVLDYEKISDYRLAGHTEPINDPETQNKLEIRVKPDTDILWVDKMPGLKIPQSVALTLLAKWPFRSIWEGICPTAQTFDFSIERKGETLWQWSKGKIFAQVQTPVSVPGAEYVKIATESWYFYPDEIKSEGIYTARAKFIATGQEAIATFEIKFAY